MLSISSCRISRPRLAPSDRRTAISCSTRRRARQQQVGDVRARDQQHETDDHHQQPARRHEVAAEGRVDRRLGQRHQRDAAAAIVVRILLRQRGRDGIHVGARLLDGDARLQAARHLKEQRAARVPVVQREADWWSRGTSQTAATAAGRRSRWSP